MELNKPEVTGDGIIKLNIQYNPETYKCCVCGDNITGKITSCYSLHSLCSSCIEGMEKEYDYKCPVCRSEDKFNNYILELAIRQILKPCPLDGCECKLFEEDLYEHINQCHFNNIECFICGDKCLVGNVISHIKNKHNIIEYSGSLDLSKINDYYILSSKIEKSRIMIIKKIDDKFEFNCIQINDCNDNCTYIGTNKQDIYINRPIDIISGNIKKTVIATSNITLDGFDEQYKTGTKWMCKLPNDVWVRGVIVKRSYNPNTVTFKYNLYLNIVSYYEIPLIDGESQYIKPLESVNNNRTTIEEIQHRASMDNDDLMVYMIDVSMEEQ